jgi:hypothetical protein
MNSVNSFPVAAKPNFNFASQAFCRGPERRLRATFGRVDPPFCRGALFSNLRFHFRVVHHDPQAGWQQKDTPAGGPQT